MIEQVNRIIFDALCRDNYYYLLRFFLPNEGGATTRTNNV